jgi:lysozyme family protein
MANVTQSINKVIDVEIGPNKTIHQLTKEDSGNYTSKGELAGTTFGYSAKLAESVNKQPFFSNGEKNPDYGVPVDKAYMQNLSKEKVIDYYEKNHAFEMKVSDYPNQHVADLVLDAAIHNGPEKAATLLQTELALNNPNSPVAIDGKIGKETIESMKQVDQVVLYNSLIDERVYAYGNYTGNSPSEQKAFQERVLQNYPHLPMNDIQEKEYQSQIQIKDLQEFVGVKPDGITGPKTWEAVDKFHTDNKLNFDDKRLDPSFLGGLHTWVEKGDVNHAATSDTKGFSNHGSVQDSVKAESYSSTPVAVSDTKSDISSTQAVSDSGSSQSQSVSGGQ